MADGFDGLVRDAQAFFTELRTNNSKEWFEPHKARYKTQIATPAALFADLMAEDLARITGKAHKPKVFRIYRDVRFSKDKTPLNAHLHLLWSPADPDVLAPSWFWGLSPDYLVLAMGVVGLQGEGLTRYRAFVDSWGDGLKGALEDAVEKGAEFGDWGPEPLKRVPKPYDQDHPHADLLRRKGFTLSIPVEGWQEAGVLKATLARVQDLKPVWDQFDQHL
ncbi:MAG: TIGR02453 family protein [Pseudomonadota bacterium]